MTESTPSLLANRAFIVQFRASSQDDPLSWEGRIEHLVSGETVRFHSQDDMCRFMARILSDVQAHRRDA